MTDKKPKILFMEAGENVMGHRRLNTILLAQLSKIAKVISVFPKNWIVDEFNLSPSFEYKPVCNIYPTFLARFIKSLKCLYLARQLDNTYHFDYLFFSSYYIFAFPLALLMLKKANRCFLLHHNILDEIDAKGFKASLTRCCFAIIRKHIHHVFIEEFSAKELLHRYKIDRRFIHYFPHPYNRFIQKRQINPEYDYVGIANSNDEDWINLTIQKEVLDETIKKAGLHIMLRSSKYSFNNGYLCVFNRNIHDMNDCEYNRIILNAKKILVPFPKNFRYRVSGTIMDALSNEIQIIGSAVPITTMFAKKYPNICKVLSLADLTTDYLVKEISNMEISKDMSRDFELFMSEHSYEKLAFALKTMFNVEFQFC